MSEEPLVSIIVPCYNHEIFIKETILSIINQSYNNIELIVINDGSIDNTNEKILEIYEDCKKRFVLFKYINRNNKGVGASLNEGILLSSGEYISFCASDDSLKPDFIECVVGDFKRLDKAYAMVSGDSCFIDEEGKRVYFTNAGHLIRSPSGAKFSSLKELTYKYHIDNFISNYGSYRSIITGGGGFIQASIFRKSILIDVGLFRIDNRVEDLGICLKISKKYKSMFIDKIFYNYRMHGKNSVIKEKSLLSKEVMKLLKIEKEYCVKVGLELEWKQRIFMQANTLIRNSDYKFLFIYLYNESLFFQYFCYIINRFHYLFKKKITLFINNFI
jgi:alpha-1,3-rhamnosyltransferase